MPDRDTKFIKISAVDQYIIDRVRLVRINLDISQKELSERISPSENNSLVGKAESTSTSHKYTDYHLHRIAFIFSQEAQRIKNQHPGDQKYTNFQTEYSLLDFYPEKALPDQLVIKSKNILDNRIFPTGAVRYLMEETDFLKIPRTTREITEEVNKIFQQVWEPSDLGSPLDRATDKGVMFPQ